MKRTSRLLAVALLAGATLIAAGPVGSARAATGPTIDPTHIFNGGLPCSNTTPPLQVSYAVGVLQASAADAQQSTSGYTFTFAIWPTTNPAAVTEATGFAPAPAEVATPNANGIPSSDFVNQATYTWHVRVSGSDGTSAWSRDCSFLYDTSSPSTPSVSSSNFPLNGVGPIGQFANFTFSGHGDKDVAGFEFSQRELGVFGCEATGDQGQEVCQFPMNAPDAVRASAPGGTATVRVQPLDAGPMTLYVRTFDVAGNISSTVTYQTFTPYTFPTVTAPLPLCGPSATFTFAPHPGITHVTSYLYSTDFATPSHSVHASAAGTAHVSLPITPGMRDVRAESVSANGFISSPGDLLFVADPQPRVTSTVYPNDGTSNGGVGIPGNFVVTPPINWGIPATYTYSFDGAHPTTVPSDPSTNSAIVSYTPTNGGVHTFKVFATANDGTGNTCDANYVFHVAGVVTSPPPTPTPTSSSTPTGPARVTGANLAGTPLGNDPTLHAGESVNLTASGFASHAAIDLTVHSAPINLGTAQADATGELAYRFTVPATLAGGAHVLDFTSGATTAAFTFQVAAAVASSSTPPLAATGSNVSRGARLAAWLLAIGTCALVAGRRSRSRRNRWRGWHV